MPKKEKVTENWNHVVCQCDIWAVLPIPVNATREQNTGSWLMGS